MSGWHRLFGRLAASPPPQPDPLRWVVVDLETTGLDTRRDGLLAIAAVGVHVDVDGRALHIALCDSFEVSVLRPGARTDKANILLHGIGVDAQRSGMAAAGALQAFEQWVGGAPLMAFHAPFDRAILNRAMKAALGREGAWPWLDLAPLAAGLHPQAGVGLRSLDDWLAHFDIPCAARHQAAADTLATAELLLRLWPAARAKGLTRFAALLGLARYQSQFIQS